jgi:predicted Fe-Mo cluster-binding NifX family protein
MRIAVVTDDGKTISRHFGRATHFLVALVEDGRIVAREMREKVGHGTFANEPHGAEHHGSRHGIGPHAQARHDQMVESIADCEALICGGMGYGAYERVRQRGIRPIISDIIDVDQAILECAEGRIVDHTDRLH